MDSGSHQGLDDRLAHLETQLQRQAAISRQASRQSVFIALTIAAIVVIFVAINIVNVRREFRRDRLEASLQKELVELEPVAVRELTELGREVLPAYTHEARRQLSDLSPTIAAKLEAEIDQLSQDILASTHSQLTTAEGRVLGKTERVLFQHYPELLDREDRDEIQSRVRTLTEDAVAKSIGDFERRFSERIDGVRQRLLEFDLADGDATAVDLQKRFIHLWLRLLDEEIMEL